MKDKEEDALNKIYSFKSNKNQKNILHKLADIGEPKGLQVMTTF